RSNPQGGASMKRALLGLSALALIATLATACTDSGSSRVGERPSDRTPSASPPTTPPSTATPTSSSDATTPGQPSSPPTSPTPAPRVPLGRGAPPAERLHRHTHEGEHDRACAFEMAREPGVTMAAPGSGAARTHPADRRQAQHTRPRTTGKIPHDVLRLVRDLNRHHDVRIDGGDLALLHRPSEST